MKLSEKAKKFLGDEQIKLKICLELGVAYFTFYRWTSKNSRKLTELRTIKAICEITGLGLDELFEQETTETESN